jgi:pimeloyl-ACP methyl ester carboxylesterase
MGGSALLVGEGGRVRAGFDGQHGTELFAEQEFSAVVVDVPSDQAAGVSDQFRVSEAHTEDMRRVIEFVSQKWPKPIFLMGHSLGTISVANLGAVLKDRRIGGVVFTGSDGGRRRISLATLPLENIAHRVLFVHHRDDGCFDIQAVRQQSRRLANSPRVEFVEVVGGNSPPGHDPCRGGNNPHTFMGTEKEVIKVIADWASGKPVAERIGQ